MAKKIKKDLIIVESPTKARTIGKFLNGKFQVESSFGHVRDLPKSRLGIDVEHDFTPQYIVPMKVKKRVGALKKIAGGAERVILATDEDREGEAIAWHLVKALGLEDGEKTKNVQRIVFHEITEEAIKEAMEHPRQIDERLVDAQQARRVLDRLVGYLLSPFLWKKIFRGLSAGRVQSAALRLIAEREEEIKKFKPEEYWTIQGVFFPEKKKEEQFTASLYKVSDKALDKLEIKNKEMADGIVADLENCNFETEKVEKKTTRRNAPSPFTTSTLQQEANKRLRFTARQTMRLAQGLYERGLITYMRTDSLNLSADSIGKAKKWLENNLGKEYALDTPRVFKNKSRLAQEAHEAVRPSNPLLKPESIEADNQEKRLYDLIWRRFFASQMPEAIFDALAIDIKNTNGKNSYIFRANGLTLKFDGFLKIWPSKFTENELPDIAQGESVNLIELKSEGHFTEPPPRYNEASLVKVLEEYGIGRPSTYAPTISVIQTRNYVEKNEQRRFQPTETGLTVDQVLKEHFPEIIDIGFTAQMEETLDKIASGDESSWNSVIKNFYEPFKKHLDIKYEEVAKIIKEPEKTDEVCDKCGKPMVIKVGRFGRFMACSGFPDCKNTKKIMEEKAILGECPKCKDGKIIMKRTKTRRFFYGCSRYPDCDYASWKRPGGETVNSD